MKKKIFSALVSAPFLVAFLCESAVCQGTTLALGTQVEKRVLINEKDTFDQNDPSICAHLTLSPALAGHVTFEWSIDGKISSTFKTDIKPSQRWRTHACITKFRSGQWKVRVLKDDQSVVAEKEFTVTSGHTPAQTKTVKAEGKTKKPGLSDALRALEPVKTEAPLDTPENRSTVPSVQTPEAVPHVQTSPSVTPQSAQ
jgi:hypothetical protein